MTINSSYQDLYPLLFAGNAGTLTVSEAEAGSTVDVQATLGTRDSLTYLYPWSSAFTVKADSSGKVSIDIKALLQSIENLLPDFDTTGRAINSTNPFGLTFTGTDASGSSAAFSKSVYRGGFPSGILDDIYDGIRFLAVRPQTYPTRTDAAETVSFLNRKGYSQYDLRACVYFGDGSTKVFSVDSSTTASAASRYIKNVSYSVIRALADADGCADLEILAYDIFVIFTPGADDSADLAAATGKSLRFVIDSGRADMFRFRSSAGVLENIWAKGCRKREVESETATLINGRIEKELANDSKVIREAFTGYIASAEEVRFWHEFLASSERYAVSGGISHRIVLDDIDTESTDGELASFSFGWHYADGEADPERIPEMTALKAYNSEILWYESEAEAETIVGKTGIQGVKVTGDSGECVLPNDADGYAELKINSPLTHDADGMGVDGSAVGSAIEITDLTV